MNRATQVWLAFDMENRCKSLMQRMAARAIARYCYQAARSGVPIARLNDYPAIYCDPVHRIAARWHLFDFAGCLLRAYYQDRNL